jgi:hypothetical protein
MMVRLLAHIRNNSGLSVSVKIILYCTESDQDSSWSYISRIVITPDISMAYLENQRLMVRRKINDNQ